MTVDLDHIINKAQKAYGVSRSIVTTYTAGGLQLHRCMPRHVRAETKIEEAPLSRMNALYEAHDYIDGVLQPLVSSLHDTHRQEQTPLRKLDQHRDVDLQAHYGTICERGLPGDPEEAEQSVSNAVQRGEPVLVAKASEEEVQTVPIQLGQLENQTYDDFREERDEDIAKKSRKRSDLTERTGISTAKRGTLISPQHLYKHQVEGGGSLEKQEVQRRLADYITFQLPDVENTDDAYERLRSRHKGGTTPFIAYMFNAFEDITGTSPIDPARGIEW